jgi:hypothetical protein
MNIGKKSGRTVRRVRGNPCQHTVNWLIFGKKVPKNRVIAALAEAGKVAPAGCPALCIKAHRIGFCALHA